jgi:hypothetical protein
MEHSQLLAACPLALSANRQEARGGCARKGRRWVARGALALCVGALVAVGYIASNTGRHDADLLQRKEKVARRYAFTQALGYSGMNQYDKSQPQEKKAFEKDMSKSCGFLEEECAGLSAAAKRQCAAKMMCRSHQNKASILKSPLHSEFYTVNTPGN